MLKKVTMTTLLFMKYKMFPLKKNIDFLHFRKLLGKLTNCLFSVTTRKNNELWN